MSSLTKSLYLFLRSMGSSSLTDAWSNFATRGRVRVFLAASPLLQRIDEPVIRELEHLHVVVTQTAVGRILHQRRRLLLEFREVETADARSRALEGHINDLRVQTDALEDLGACVCTCETRRRRVGRLGVERRASMCARRTSRLGRPRRRHRRDLEVQKDAGHGPW